MTRKFGRSILGFDKRSIDRYYHELDTHFREAVSRYQDAIDKGNFDPLAGYEQRWIDTKARLAASPFRAALFGQRRRSVMRFFRQTLRLQDEQLEALRIRAAHAVRADYRSSTEAEADLAVQAEPLTVDRNTDSMGAIEIPIAANEAAMPEASRLIDVTVPPTPDNEPAPNDKRSSEETRYGAMDGEAAGGTVGSVIDAEGGADYWNEQAAAGESQLAVGMDTLPEDHRSAVPLEPDTSTEHPTVQEAKVNVQTGPASTQAASVKHSTASNVLAFPVRAANTEAVQPSAIRSVHTETGAAAQREKRPKAVGSGYWDNAEDYLHQALGPAEYTVATVETAADRSFAFSQPPHKPVSQEPVRTEAPVPIQEPKDEDPLLHAAPQPEDDSQRPAEAEAHEGSRAISDEIVHLRRRYIVGKIAGEDLYARNGRLIAAKGQPITEAVMNDADREGKLAELIVNMVINGLGD